MRGNGIHDGKDAGIHVYEGGQGLYENNEIYQNGTHGIFINKKGAGTFKRNTLYKNKMGSWYISDDSKPLVTLEGNVEK